MHKDSLRGSQRIERKCFDVLHYTLQIKVDTIHKTIEGSCAMTFNLIQKSAQIQLDLFENMHLDEILFRGKKLTYSRDGNAIFINIPADIPLNEPQNLQIKYNGKPIIAKKAPWDGGFVWKHDKLGKLWMGVACEGIGASSWWPCKDHLSDEPDQGITLHCSVPNGLKCISNGVESNPSNELEGFTTFHWNVSYPINNYNLTLCIGDYVHFDDKYTAQDGAILDLDYYVLSYNLDTAKKQFEQVKPMLRCYEKFLGKYPFWKDGYALVETPYLGMEHQGAIAYGNQFKTGYNGIDFSRIGLDFDYIIIHESGHEWWGNSVSCEDIADMWIHEGFCTYSESIYVECMFDKSKAIEYINAKKSSIQNKAPIQGPYGVNEEGDGDMYAKGSLMLNTLRTVVNNDALWWNTIKAISDTAFKIKNTNAQEIIDFMCQKTGKNLRPIMEQYIQHADLPILDYKLTKKGKLYFLKYRYLNNVKNDFSILPVLANVDGKLTRIENCSKKGSYFVYPFDMKDKISFSLNPDFVYYKEFEKKK